MRCLSSKKLFLVFAAGFLFILAGCFLNSIDVNISGTSAIISAGTDMTVSAETSEPVDSYRWFLNGVPIRGETSSIITIGSALSPGDYRLDIVVVKGREIGKNGFRFSVTVDNDGLAQWVRTSTNAVVNFFGTATAADGSVYCSGWVSGEADFGNGVTNTVGYAAEENILLVKYDSEGTAQWAKSMVSGNGESLFNSVSIASDGSVYAAGYINGSTPYDFGNGVTVAGVNLGRNMLLVKYDADGSTQWAKTIVAGSNTSDFSTVSVSSDGSIYASGDISGTDPYDFGNGVTVAGINSGRNMLLIKYDADGLTQWAKTTVAGNNTSTLTAVSVSPDGSVYVSGNISGTDPYDFGNGVTVAGINSGRNMLLVKYDADGSTQWAKTIVAGSNTSDLTTVSASPDGSVYASGSIGGTDIFDFGNGVTATGMSSIENMVIVKYDGTGLAQWANTVTADNDNAISLLSGITTSPDDSLYAVGYMSYISGESYDFGNGVTLTAANLNGNLVLLKYDSAGRAQWVQTATASDNMSASNYTDVSAAPDGSVYAAGAVFGSLDFGNDVTVAGSIGSIIVKYR